MSPISHITTHECIYNSPKTVHSPKYLDYTVQKVNVFKGFRQIDL